MAWESALGEVFDKIKVARQERQRCLLANSQAVRTLRAQVQRRKMEMRRDLQHEAQVLGRNLKRFVERNRVVTQRYLTSARASRARHLMRHQFAVASSRNERRRVVQSILRKSATMRRIAEGQRLRSAQTTLSSIRSTVSRIKQMKGVNR